MALHECCFTNTSIPDQQAFELWNIRYALFHSDELQFNITKHRYVPPHELVPPDEAAQIKKRYNTKLAVLLTSDPVARFYGFGKGDVIRVTRKCGIAYRIVK